MVCILSEKYVVLVTLKPLGSTRQGKANLCTLQYHGDEAKLCTLKLTLEFHHLPCVSPKQLCEVVHLGSIQKRVPNTDEIY